MLFSKRLTPAPPLAMCLEATIQGHGPSFQAELLPVRSPLLRESCLVSFPPLTYMLKFSRFAGLTSCCSESDWTWMCLQQRPSVKKQQKPHSNTEAVTITLNFSCQRLPFRKTAPNTHQHGSASWHMKCPETLKQASSQGFPESAVHVQTSIGSRNSAIHNDYHTSLRPSSVLELRYPLLKVVETNSHR